MNFSEKNGRGLIDTTTHTETIGDLPNRTTFGCGFGWRLRGVVSPLEHISLPVKVMGWYV